MPQFDAYSFSGQVFWTLSGFYFFYFFSLHFYVTKFSSIFKMRQKLITTFIKDSDVSARSVNSFNFFFPSNKIN